MEKVQETDKHNSKKIREACDSSYFPCVDTPPEEYQECIANSNASCNKQQDEQQEWFADQLKKVRNRYKYLDGLEEICK